MKARQGALHGKHYQLIKETEEIAKGYGFNLGSTYDGKITLFAQKGLPHIMFGRKHFIAKFNSIDDVRSWMLGWAFLEDNIFDKTNLTLADFKDLIKQREVLDKLKGEDEEDKDE